MNNSKTRYATYEYNDLLPIGDHEQEPLKIKKNKDESSNDSDEIKVITDKEEVRKHIEGDDVLIKLFEKGIVPKIKIIDDFDDVY